MMAWRLFRRVNFLKQLSEKQKRLFLTLDIGTEAVKVLICSFSPVSPKRKKTINVLSAGMEYFETYDVFEKGYFKIGAVEKAIQRAVEKARQNLSFSKIKKESKQIILKQKKWNVLMSLPSNILKARVVYEDFIRKNHKEKISRGEERYISDYIFQSAKRTISQEFSREAGILPDDIDWIYSEISDIKIDGYPVSSCRGLQGRKIEFRVLNTFIFSHYFKSIKRAVESLNLKNLDIVHIVEGLFSLCGEDKQDCVFIDVGGETTQIFSIEKGKLNQVCEFKQGAKLFSENLSQTLGIDEKTAKIMVEDYSQKNLSGSVMERIKEIFSDEKKNWAYGINNCLKKADIKSFNIFLFGGGSTIPEIAGALEESGFSGIKFISLKDFNKINNFCQVLDNSQYVPCLFILSSFLKTDNKR